jgi:hypothetical protein
MDWFANKGQVVQIIIALGQFVLGTAVLILALRNAFPAMSNGNFFSAGAILFYVLATLVFISTGVSIWFSLRRKNNPPKQESVPKADLLGRLEAVGIKVPPLLPFPAGYDRLIPARSRQDGIEEGYEKAKQIWAASIAGVYFSHLRAEDRKKITQVLLVDPDSALMETLVRIQPLRGEGMPGSVKEAVKICKDEKIEVKLSSHPLLNVVLFDPGTPHAWARVQEFIPYFPGEESGVYAIRKEEWENLYNKIESSFRQAWKNGRDPTDIN